MLGKRARVFRDAHLVFVENNDKIKIRSAVVECLVHHTARKCAVSNNGNAEGITSGNSVALCKADSSGDGGGAVSRTECIVLALSSACKTGKTSRPTKLGKLLSSAREKLVHVALMSNVEDDVIVWCVENSVKRNGKLHNAEIRGKMSARFGHVFHKKRAYLSRKRGHFFHRHSFKVARRIYSIKKRIFFHNSLRLSQVEKSAYQTRRHVPILSLLCPL